MLGPRVLAAVGCAAATTAAVTGLARRVMIVSKPLCSRLADRTGTRFWPIVSAAARFGVTIGANLTFRVVERRLAGAQRADA